jgi:4-alpha-glucanotransferase
MPDRSSARPRGFAGRSSGLLLHLTSLPGPHGSGDLGPEAHRFLGFLQQAGQSWWQMLPIGPPGRPPAFSPYDGASAFAGSPWLVSLTLLARQGLLSAADLTPAPEFRSPRLNFPATLRFREERLRRAFARFRRRRGERGRAFREFCQRSADWLEDYALFAALRRASGGNPWTEWEPEVRTRQPSALRAAGERLADEMAAQRFAQFAFARQWQALREQSRRCGIGLIGDLPIFVAHDSADVWCHQELFRLDGRGQPRRVSGYPPDRFNRNGQRWGHPQYRWAAHEQSGFAWWVQRFTRLFELFDAVRVDHFLGFTRTWSIPADAVSPRSGRWVSAPGARLFAAVRKRLGSRPMIAEDLGQVTDADIRLRDAFGLAPMRIFQFGFGRDADSAAHLPHHYPPLCAAYTGNHDNNTTAGWFDELTPAQRRRVLAYTGGRPASVPWDSLRTLQGSRASLVLCPLQDILGLGRRARMNVPGTARGNWSWRLRTGLRAATARRLRLQTELFGRQRHEGNLDSTTASPH